MTERASHLVSVGWLLDRPEGIRVLDVTARLDRDLVNRAHDACFIEAHIPGAVHFDVASAKGALSNPEADLPWMWPSAERVTESLRAAGVDDGDLVVITAGTPRPGIDSGTMWCTRAWWTLTRMGVPAVVLEGGNEAWVAAGHPVEAGAVEAARGSITVRPRDGGRADADGVLEALDAGNSCVVDALSRDNYEGRDPGYGPRRGHITGADNVPYLDLIEAETAAFKPLEEIQGLLSGVLGHDRVVTYCGGAIAATVVAFCLDMCGHGDVRVYDGSLMEWSRRDDLPMTDPSAG
jgi:thiosulfate/3-mercaptopyruvate sulfurtransferase